MTSSMSAWRARLAALLVVVLLSASVAAAQVTRDAAVDLVRTTQLGGTLDGVRLWVADSPLAAGSVVATWRRDAITAPAPSWFVFVDRHPGANWEHPCWYFVVDVATGQITRADATTPPRDLARLTEITHGRDNPPPGVSEAQLDRFSARLRELPHPPVRAGAWALIISGGADPSNNHIRYWNDCAMIYRALVDYYGYADDHIRVCMSDGTNPAVDRSDGTNSPTDLDGDGDADIEYPATRTYIDQVFGELAATLTSDDQLFIYTTDHGGQESGQDCYLNLWNWETLPDDQLAGLVATLPCGSIICTFEQCFSGGMIDDLAGDGRVIATAANWDEYSWAMGPDYIYDTFVYHWTNAVAWETPQGVPVDADANHDGIISMREAFLYAEANDFEDETPQYSSTPTVLGDALNLIGNLEGVYLLAESVNLDGDGIAAFGETVQIQVALHNLGQSEGAHVTGTLTATSPHVTVVTGESDWGAIPAGETVVNAEPLVIALSPDIDDGEPLGLVLTVNETPGDISLALDAAAPAYFVTVAATDDVDGDHDGLADPGETVMVTLSIANVGSFASPQLSAWLEGDSDFTVLSGAQAVAAIPAGESALVTGFEVAISPDCPPTMSRVLPLHLTGPDGYAIDASAELWVGPWFDDAEADRGWTLGLPTDSAATGQWVLADPVGTVYGAPEQQVQPEDDHTLDPGHMCFVTGNGSVGGAAGEADVDGGTTTLLSPVFDVAGASSVTLSYWRWYTNDLGNNPGQDTWRVDVTADGVTWIALESTLASDNSWIQHTFDLGQYVPLSGTLQVRFVADDEAPGSLVEAAVDDIMMEIVRMSATPVTEPGVTMVSGLGLCRPNPIGPRSVLSYRLASAGPVRIDLFDVAGHRVRTLQQGTMARGEHEVTLTPFDGQGRRIAAGIYFVRMQTPGFTQVRQVTIVR